MTWVEGEVVQHGATAVLTRGAPGTVVKTYYGSMLDIVGHLEADGTRVAMAAGLPVAALLADNAAATPPSLTFAYVEGEQLARRAQSVGPEHVGFVLAELQHRIRQVPNPELITPEEFLGFQIRDAVMPDSLAEAALRDLERLTKNCERVLCHMDLHDANVMWSNGPDVIDGPVIIDWMNAQAAPPEADVARTRLVVGHEKFYSPDEEESLEAVLEAFVRRTEQLVPGIVGASRAWDRVLNAARLHEGVPDAERDAILARFAR